MVYFLRLFGILLLFFNAANAGRIDEDDILDALQQSGYQGVTRQHIQELNNGGSNTESICLLYLNQESEEKRPFICKELKGIKNEQKNLEDLVPFVTAYEEFKKSQPYEFPDQYVSLAAYKGALKAKNKDFVLFKQARGQSVFDLMLEWSQKGYKWSGLYPADIKDHLLYAFTNVGRAIANFHLKYGVFDEETNTFKTITHGDLHISNVFYDLWSNETTLIDYETMVHSYKSKRDIYQDIKRLLDFSKQEAVTFVQEKAGAEFCLLKNIWFLDQHQEEEKISYISKKLAVLDDFFIALENGYTKAFKAAGYIVDTNTGQVKKDFFQ